ncbi:MAG TPA: Hsp20/alpha crystallin family protein [Bacteroidales bacterium]|nr:Hsp20/alpha crystallin family protein [Bacteroidales bacterium]HPS63777.1 Hsp20/alpha crystallin family protein [Bacteroidales bacterium]
MTLIKWQHRNPLSDMVSNIFDNDLGDFFGKRFTDPAANIIEKNDSFHLEIAAPGMQKDDFCINLENNILTISAEVEDQKREEDKNYSRKEFYYGSFSRSFTLPKTIDLEKIKAEYINGILNVELPKKEEARVEMKKEIKVS